MPRQEHDSESTGPDDTYWSWSVRLNLASGAIATAKLTLDAALAGYYSQAYGLLRHMAETWEQMVFLRLNESTALRWFSPDETSPAREPSQGTILRGIRKHGKKERGLLDNLTLVEKMICELNKGAHPSGLMMVQVSTETPGMRQLGANFNKDLLGVIMDRGTVFMAMLLREIEYIVPVEDAWQAESDLLGEEQRQWHKAAFGEEPSEDVPESPAT
jgi:hypothetical protein